MMLSPTRPSRRFQSTPSARRATKHQLSKSSGRHISIHALREEGDGRKCSMLNSGRISIHALREEGDRTTLQ